jgi:hypothetical protein
VRRISKQQRYGVNDAAIVSAAVATPAASANEAKPGGLRRAVVVLMVIAAVAVVAQPAYAAPPANDTPSGATLISALPFSDVVTIDEATTDELDATLNGQCGAPATEGSVWYRFDATEDGTVAFDVSESSFTAGALVTAGNPADGNVVTCGPGAVSFDVTAGQTYYIMAFSDTPGVTTGTLVVHAQAVEPLAVDITVNPIGSFNPKTGSATISGTLTCSEPAAFAFVTAELSQSVGRVKIIGSNGVEAACSATPEPWSVEVLPTNGKFAGGKAVSVAFAFACGDFSCGMDFEQTRIMLRR